MAQSKDASCHKLKNPKTGYRVMHLKPGNNLRFVSNWQAHLAKRSSDLKQNGTQERTPFSGTVLHTLSHSVLFLLVFKEFQPVTRCFFELTLTTKRITSCEKAWKTLLENGVFSCVPFCLRSLGCFERYDESFKDVNLKGLQRSETLMVFCMWDKRKTPSPMTETVYKMGPWSSAVEQRQEEKVLLISNDKSILISELAAIAGLLKGRRKVHTFQYSLYLFC